jgi:hypothetical protein
MKLYDLAEEVRSLADQLEEMDLDSQTMLDTLEGSTAMMSLEQKAEAIIKMMKNWESEIPGYKSEIDRLTAKKVAAENRVKSVKNYLKMCMEKAGLQKVKVGVFAPRLQINSRGSVIVDSKDLVPAKYFDIIPEQKVVNNDRLYQDLKDGVKVPGVRYEVGQHLRVG